MMVHVHHGSSDFEIMLYQWCVRTRVLWHQWYHGPALLCRHGQSVALAGGTLATDDGEDVEMRAETRDRVTVDPLIV
jgi:hypothetical protein